MGGIAGKAGIEGIVGIAGIGGTEGLGETGVSEVMDVGAGILGTECIAGIGIGGIIVPPLTGRTGTAEWKK